MKKTVILLALAACVSQSFAQQKTKKNQKTNLNSKVAFSNLDSVAYSLGMLYGQNLQKLGVEILPYDKVILGLKAAIEKQSFVLNNEQAQSVSKAYLEKRRTAWLDKLKAENANFLKKNATNPHVKTTASGLQYEVITAGTGVAPKDTSTVVTHYVGKLIDGSEFDNSYKRNQPLTIKTNQVIKGWTEGLQLMTEGAKYRLYIPYDLAYGERGQGQIPPFSTLVFEVELLKVQ